MKKILVSIVLVITMIVGCKKTENNTREVNKLDTLAVKPPVSKIDSINLPIITFEQPDYDFGTIKQGDVVKHVFKFTNTGKSPLIIDQAVASCGCTVPKWPKDPIKPGDSGEIYAEFNSAGKNGVQKKTISIKANTNPDQTTITLTGTVNTN